MVRFISEVHANILQDFQSYSTKLFCEVNSRTLLRGSCREKAPVAWKH